MTYSGEGQALHNVTLEQELIGAVLVNNEVFDRVSNRFDAADFFDPFHQRIWSCISDRLSKGKSVSATILAPILRSDPAIDQLPAGIGYIAQLAGAAVSISTAPDTAEMITDLANRRNIVAALDQAREGVSSNADPAEVSSLLEAQMMVVHDRSRADRRSVSFLKAGAEMIDIANDAYQADGAAGVSFGIPELDDATGGMMPGESIIMAARSSMGKTATALHVARRAAERGDGVWFASLEMAPHEIAQRMVSSMAWDAGVRVPYQAIRRGSMEEAQFKSVIECTRNAKDLPMHISPPTLRDIGGLRAEARSVKKRMEARGTPLRLIVFDYIQRMQHQGEKIDVLNAASAMVKDLAVQFGVPVITLSQLNRDVEARAGQGKGSIPKPRLSDLKGSGAIEEDADMVIFVHRDEYYLDQIKNKSADWQEMKERAAGKMDLIIGKFRNGQRIDVTVDVNMPCNIILRPRRAASSDQQDFGL